MPAQDFELILRVQADLQTAVQQLRTLNDQMRVVKTGATEASTGLQTLTSSARSTENSVRGINAQLKSFGGAASAIGSQLKMLAGALGALAAIRSMANFVKDVIDADSALGDMAQKVGVSTEALSALGGVAKRNGSDLQGVQSAFVNLARAGTGLNQTGVKALQAMNINLDKFRQLKPEQQFDLVAQKFAGYNDGANKAALATALFGRSGADLIPTLNQVGKEGLQNLTDKAIAAGTAVGKDAADAAQKYSNAMQTLKEKLQGATNEGLAQFTPVIERLAALIDSPDFQNALQSMATTIATAGENAVAAADKLSKFINVSQQVVGFALDNTVSGEASYLLALNKLSELEAQQDARKNGVHKLTSSDLTLGFGETTPGFLSDAELARRIALLKSATAAYRKQAAAPPKNPQEGDERGLFVGLGGKTMAPIVATGGAGQADKLVQQAAKAQDDLTQALIRLQGQLDPTAAAYAAYNATVKQANDNADLAKKAHGADAQAIDTQRDAVIALAGKIRDAALDQIAEKDRQAWEALKRSFETPAQVAVDDALKKIEQLNELLKKGTISAAEYHDALSKVGASSVSKAPQYQGLDAAVGGIGSELRKNFDAQNQLEAWHQEALKENERFRQGDLASEEAYQAGLANIDQQYAQQRNRIETARGQLQLQTASDIFGQLASLSSSGNKKIAAIGKAAAIADTIIKTYQSATNAYAALSGIPYVGPALGAAAAAAAIAAGLANVAQIRSQNTGGYSGGGYTGPGAVNQPAGIVHAGEVVFSQRDVARFGGVTAVETARLRGYADGGFVNPLRNAPSPAQMGFQAPAALPVGALARVAGVGSVSGAAPQPTDVKVVVLMDKNDVANELLNSPTGQKVIVKTVGDNPNSIRGKWGS